MHLFFFNDVSQKVKQSDINLKRFLQMYTIITNNTIYYHYFFNTVIFTSMPLISITIPFSILSLNNIS